MKAKAVVKYIRISSRKARLVLPLIRKKKALDAVIILEHTNKKAAKIVSGALNSAIANAKGKKMDLDNCVVSDARVDVGPTFKRLRPRAMGRADRVLKRSSHIIVELSEEAAANVEQEKVTTSSRR